MSIVIIEGTPPEPTDPSPTVIISYQGPAGKTGPIGPTGNTGPIGPIGPVVPTNLSVTGQTATGLTIASDTGTGAAVPQATGSLAGLQSAADKAKEDILWNIGPDIASAPTMDIGANPGDIMTVTGNTGITGFTSAPVGIRKKLILGSSLGITHNSTSLIMPSALTLTYAAGNILEFVSLGSGNWRCVDIMSLALEITAKTSSATTLSILASARGIVGSSAASYTIPRADDTHAGIISAAEWNKLSGITATAIAAETISASKIVRINAAGEAELAQPDGKGVLGIALNSATIGQSVEIKTSGLHIDAGINLTTGWQFLAAAGTLTPTPPSSGWLYRLGYSPQATRLELVIETPMEL